jgi:phosphohistidine phosphatase
MRDIYLLRHAKAEPARAGQNDFDRPLAPAGQSAARALGHYLRQHDFEVDRVLCSAALRTRETWSALAVEDPQADAGGEELYLASASTLLARLRALDPSTASVLLIGHNPGLEDLSSQLIASGPPRMLARLEQGLPTCALVHVRVEDRPWAELKLGSATLIAYVVGKEL